MIAALALMCALSAAECRSSDAHRLARAIDATTEDDGLRAVLVVYSHAESGWRASPRPESWDARQGRARGFLQLWGPAGGASPEGQCREWLARVQASSLALVSGYGRAGRRIAARRARVAAQLLEAVR